MIARTTIALALGTGLLACRPSEPAGADAAPAAPEAVAETATDAGPAATARDDEVTPDDLIHDAVLAAANATLSEQAGFDVALRPEIFRSEGPWAFVYGPVLRPDGQAVDWTRTPFAPQIEAGMMDGDLGVVLLNWLDGEWRVVEAVVGATDVPQAGWPAEHHVSPALVGMEG